MEQIYQEEMKKRAKILSEVIPNFGFREMRLEYGNQKCASAG